MKKFNGFENWMLRSAVTTWVELAEKDILDKIAQNEAETDKTKKKGNPIFAPGYFTMVSKDLLKHIDDLTKVPKK